MPKKKKPTPKNQPISFEESLAKLEQVVTDLESGEIGLDDSLQRYEEGIQHIRRCRAELEQAEKRIEMLVNIDEEGRAVVQPMQQSSGTVTGMSVEDASESNSDDETEDGDKHEPTLF